MPTVARCPRACVICERCPASAAPTRDLCLHADDAPVRREQRAEAAHAPCRPCLRSTRAARPICAAPLRPGLPRTRDGMPTTAWRDASSAPDLRRPPSTWPATAPACRPQSTAQPCCIHTTLSAPRGFTCMRRSRTGYESGARHQANSVRDWLAQRASGASLQAKKNPALCQGAGQSQQCCQCINYTWVALHPERPSWRRSDRGHSS